MKAASMSFKYLSILTNRENRGRKDGRGYRKKRICLDEIPLDFNWDSHTLLHMCMCLIFLIIDVSISQLLIHK